MSSIGGKGIRWPAKNLNAKQKGVLISAYKATVSALAQTGWLTTVQAATLDQLVNAL